jgi:hypothetical protein
MHAESTLEDTQKLQLPQDLLNAVNSGGQKRVDYGIEALKPSLFGRFVEKLIGPRK